ncbi:hypothetical protein RQM59_06520 [Flavobacteriaceae bacterium S356]|uniref:Uncharacterized protein n=1 Tax=Asprobacillus argus TaxID=3076534 RepID=A0ABU3LE72_9FLAO|nr:hypothetical protein [Flavobacteriaceae bacterium S356]
MKIRSIITTFLVLFYNISFSQEPINVANLNVSLSFQETKDYFFTFDKGDEIVFNFVMKKGKHIRSVEIASSSNVKLTEFKAKEITNRKIQVLKKEIYRFRFFSSSLTTRVANVQIQRIPSKNGSPSFNTGWKWYTVRDTIYVPYQKDSLIGYQMIPYQETIKEIVNTKKEEILLFQKSQRVHSYYNRNKSRTYLRVDLPRLEITDLKKEKILAWAYWIGVGEEGKAAYDKNVRNFSKFIGKAANAYFQTPLAGLALGFITELFIPNNGHDVAYYFMDEFRNVQSFLDGNQFSFFDSGKGRAAFGRNDSRLWSTFYIGLSNDNLTKGIDVEVKVIAIKETQTFKYNTYNKEKKEAQYMKLNKTRMQVKEKKYRVPVE